MKEIITTEMDEIRLLIAETVTKRNFLKFEMEDWYKTKAKMPFDRINELITIDSTLSQLDSHYKRLWDYHNDKSISD